ncbi:MAG: hypothetical protein AB1941_23170 [Gemmatimonadota bacterium]
MMVGETHDDLAFAIAEEAVRQIRTGRPPWDAVFSVDAHFTTSRNWPVPDFVIVDNANGIKAAGEFKPPNQSKREYLTGLGQATAYTRDFHHGLLILPEVADDGYRIADHVLNVVSQDVVTSVPLGLLVYDPRTFSQTNPAFDVRYPLRPRVGALTRPASVEESFWAKWREVSPEELGRFVTYLFEEGHRGGAGTIRDRAFARLWTDIVGGAVRNWRGNPRAVSNTAAQRTAWGKNFRNFLFHIGWTLGDGRLTETGLEAFRLVHQYGADSQIFLDFLTREVLLAGKHLVLINSLVEFQNHRIRTEGPFPEDRGSTHLDEVEVHLEDRGFVKRNPGRHGAAVHHAPRGFFKAEKQLWRELGLLVPYGPAGGNAYHPRQGFVFDWTRITSLLTTGR